MKPLILIKFLFFSIFLYGQLDTLKNYNLDFSNIKSKIFQSIILSKEFKNDTQCKMVVISPFSLGAKEKYEYLEPYKKRDSLTLGKLRNELPSNYWIYQINNDLEYINKGNDLIDYYINSDSIYVYDKLLEHSKERKSFTNNKGFFYHYCDDEFDIIKIYEPFDKWSSLYFNSKIIEIVIPVKYEHLERFNNKEKYFLYKIELYENGTEIKSVKSVEIE